MSISFVKLGKYFVIIFSDRFSIYSCHLLLGPSIMQILVHFGIPDVF